MLCRNALTSVWVGLKINLPATIMTVVGVSGLGLLAPSAQALSLLNARCPVSPVEANCDRDRQTFQTINDGAQLPLFWRSVGANVPSSGAKVSPTGVTQKSRSATRSTSLALTAPSQSDESPSTDYAGPAIAEVEKAQQEKKALEILKQLAKETSGEDALQPWNIQWNIDADARVFGVVYDEQTIETVASQLEQSLALESEPKHLSNKVFKPMSDPGSLNENKNNDGQRASATIADFVGDQNAPPLILGIGLVVILSVCLATLEQQFTQR